MYNSISFSWFSFNFLTKFHKEKIVLSNSTDKLFWFADMSHMLIETRRNREMCNQIARKVFYDQSSTTKIAPVGPVVSILMHMFYKSLINFTGVQAIARF